MFNNLDNLAWNIILVLLENGPCTTADVDRLISLSSQELYSSATIYRRIESLERSRILFKSRRQLIVNLEWIERAREFLSRIGDADTVARNVGFLLPQREGSKRDFFADSLEELDPIWNSFLIHIGSQDSAKRLYGYNSRAWYPLGMPEHERALYRALARQKVTTHLVMGGDAAVELGSIRRIDTPSLTVTRVEPEDQEDNRVVWASDRYLMECRLPGALIHEFCAIFDAIDACPQDIQCRIDAVFRQKVRCCLRVYKSQRRARALRESVSARARVA